MPKLKTNAQTKYCALLPAFNEASHIGETVKRILEERVSVIVIDDGSTDKTAKYAKAAGAHVIQQPSNMGKGIALETGFKYAKENGYHAVITMDADGQHAPGEIPKFIQRHEKENVPIIIGNRMENNENMPLIRRWTNAYMSWRLSRLMKQRVPDTQNGYRLYQCTILPEPGRLAHGFAAESEILLYFSDQHHGIESVPITTIYGDEKSKIHPLRDTFRFFKMLWKYQFLKR